MPRLVPLLAALGLAVFVSATAIAASFGWTFTYQGRLVDNGAPVDGSRNMSFRLFDATAGGNPVGSQIDQLVPVADGLFTADLDFTLGGTVAGIFDGNDRWLEIAIEGNTLAPRQKLTTTPHAAVSSIFQVPLAMSTDSPSIMHLISNANTAQVRAVLVETNSTEIGAQAITGVHNDATNEGVGVAGVSMSTNGFGVVGRNNALTGNNAGIFGLSESPNGTGVYGFASSATGANRGVFGQSDSAQGHAGYFQGRGFFSGPVGIGTADPELMLEVNATGVTNLALGGKSDSAIGTWLGLRNTSNGGGNWALISTGSANAEGANKLLIHNAATVTTRMTIADNFVGVGRSTQVSGSEQFGIQSDVSGNTYGGMYINTSSATGRPFYGYSNTGGDIAWHYLDGLSGQWRLFVGGSDRLVVGPTGMVGIGTTAPGFMLHVNGSAGKPGGGSWSVASDIRLKHDVVQLDGALDRLLAIRGVTFEYNDAAAIQERSGTQIGVIAQEVEPIFPGWVDDGSDGYKRVTFRGFEAVAIEALRELRTEKDAEIASLRAEAAAKDAQISDLAARLQRLESSVERLARTGGGR